MRSRAALALVLAGGAALAQEATELAPEVAPAPEARPEDRSGAGEVPQLIPPAEMPAEAPATEGTGDGPSPDAAGAEAGTVEKPSPALPEDAEAATPEDGTGPRLSFPPGLAGAPAAELEESAGAPMREVLAETESELAACLAALDELGVAYERAEPILEPDAPDCGIANPLTVSQIVPGVALEPAPTLRCEAALAAARWVADLALPLGTKLPGRGALVAIDQGTAYLCRPRADGELSEHAFGNALDVMGFRFETGDPIPVQPRAGDGTLEEAFQRAVSAGACLDFTTVLSPGSDADHADHLHLDIKTRDGGFRICE